MSVEVEAEHKDTKGLISDAVPLSLDEDYVKVEKVPGAVTMKFRVTATRIMILRITFVN